MKIDFPYGQVPIIFDEDSAIKCKDIIDENIAEKNQHIEKRRHIITKTTQAILVLLGVFILITILNKSFQFIELPIENEIIVLFLIASVVLISGFALKFSRMQLEENTPSYPVAVKFLMLKNQVNILKAVVTCRDDRTSNYRDLFLFWIDDNDEVHRRQFTLERKYKKGINSTEVDMNKACVYEPLVMGVPFSEKPNPKEYTK